MASPGPARPPQPGLGGDTPHAGAATSLRPSGVPLGSIERVLALWQGQTAPAARRAALGLGVVGLVAAMLVARAGAGASRVVALSLIIAGALPWWLARWVARRREQDPRSVLAVTLLQTQPELGRAALRALTLIARTATRKDTGSPELARLHLGKLLGRAAMDPIARRADTRAWWWSTVGMAFAVSAFVAVAIDPFRMVEGALVFGARGGVAPVAVTWTDDPYTAVEAPAYLDMPRTSLRSHYPTALPIGSTVVVRASLRHAGRQLVLTDGKRHEPFHDDGHGAVVARWVIERDVSLVVAARFGEVLIHEPRRLEVTAIADLAPVIRLAKAPATLKLLEHARIPIHWEATDDHGLREVVLVLRSGEREERRTLSKPQGGSTSDRGGIDLLSHDKFLEKSHVPITITVEALDNDPVTGPKWGKSEPFVVIPPQVGELEAMRHRALSAARDVVTDLLASRVRIEVPSDRAQWAALQTKQQREAFAKLDSVLKQDFGGLRIPGRVVAAARGQMERVEVSLAAASRDPAKPALEKLRDATESALLSLDAVIDALGDRDSRVAALKLADVAQEAAAAIGAGREPHERASADRRLDAALSVLEGGSRNMVRLGGLGRDLGEIIENDLGRVRRAMSTADRHHARLAAEDLAARLRQPDPSFGSSGGSTAGTEAGSGGEENAQPPSDAASDAAAVEQALEELRRDHASEMSAVERALDQALSEEAKQSLREELRQIAERAREAVKDLPEQGADPGSARSDAAQGRSQAEGMASALERGDLSQAAENGQRALDSLDRAKKKGADAPDGTGERDAGEQAGEAAGKLRDMVSQAQKRLGEMRKKASEAAGSALEHGARRERALADRARRIRQQSEASEAPLPKPMLDKLEEASKQMEDAAKQLERHEGSKGLEGQRQAQRLLEMAQPESEQEGDHGGSKEGKDGREMAKDADVPEERKDELAERFRKRVTTGLGKKTPPHLRDAVRRYTEGLLR